MIGHLRYLVHAKRVKSSDTDLRDFPVVTHDQVIVTDFVALAFDRTRESDRK
jgi:hypothetical protein